MLEFPTIVPLGESLEMFVVVPSSSWKYDAVYDPEVGADFECWVIGPIGSSVPFSVVCACAAETNTAGTAASASAATTVAFTGTRRRKPRICLIMMIPLSRELSFCVSFGAPCGGRRKLLCPGLGSWRWDEGSGEVPAADVVVERAADDVAGPVQGVLAGRGVVGAGHRCRTGRVAAVGL